MPDSPGSLVLNENKVTLDQWRTLIAVVDAGGYAKAAEFLNKSQSTVSYAIAQLEQSLSVKAFHIQGRKAVPSPAGEVLYRKAKELLEQAHKIEKAAIASQQQETQIRIAADLIIPSIKILHCLELFSKTWPHIRVEIYESVLSGTEDALLQRIVDLAIGGRVPPGFIGEKLMTVTMRGVSSPDHPLQLLGREIDQSDLKRHRQIIIRDSGQYRRHSEGWQEAEQRWTVSHIKTSLDAIRMGLGYAWLPESYIEEDIQSGKLKFLPVASGATREVTPYLIFADQELAGPAVQELAKIMINELSK